MPPGQPIDDFDPDTDIDIETLQMPPRPELAVPGKGFLLAMPAWLAAISLGLMKMQ